MYVHSTIEWYILYLCTPAIYVLLRTHSQTRMYVCTYILGTVRYAALAIKINTDSESEYSIAEPARNSFLYGSYVESSFTTQNTKHKGAHNHGITMTKCGKFVNQNSAGMIGVFCSAESLFK
jgi:hypothetical protein